VIKFSHIAFLIGCKISPDTVKGNSLDEGCKGIGPFTNLDSPKGLRRWKFLRVSVDVVKDVYFGCTVGFVDLDDCVRQYADNGSCGVLVE
jgi:hypothetical protein